MRAVGAVAVAILAIAFGAGQAQSVDGMRAGVNAPVVANDSVVPNLGAPFSFPLNQPARLRKYAPLASAIVPGSGQALLGNDRFVGYLAVEALAWWMYAKDISERSAREAQFKEIAREVARAHYSTTLPDGPWSYYEWMRDFKESGVYSQTTSGPVVPETDVSTYNGQRWATLQSIYATDAEALVQYQRDAIKPEYRWSWVNHGFERDIYTRYTDKRNDANRAAVRDLLLVAANHFLSMLDAFTTARLQVDTGPEGQTRVGARLKW